MIIFDLFEDNNNNPQNLVEGVNDGWFTQGSFIAAKKSAGREAFRILKQPEVIKSLEGNLQGKAGDYVITGPNGEEYLNSPEKFLQLKTDNGDGTASPKAIPKQVKLADHDGVLNTSWGDLQYTAGNDYIIRHGTGDYGAVKKDIFPKTYDVIKEEDLDEINRRGFLGLMGAGLGAAALAGLPDVAQAGNLEFGGPEHKYYGRLKRAHKDLMDNPAYSKEAESPKYLGPGGSNGFNSRSMFMRTDEVEAIITLLPLLKKYGVDIQTGAPDSIRASTNSVAKAASATTPVIKPSKVGRGVYSMNLPDGTEALMYVGRPEARMTKSLKAMLNGKPVTVFLTVDGREGVIPPESMQEGVDLINMTDLQFYKELLAVLLIPVTALGVSAWNKVMNSLRLYRAEEIVQALQKKGITVDRDTFDQIKPLLQQLEQAIDVNNDGDAAKELAQRIQQTVSWGKLKQPTANSQSPATARNQQGVAEGQYEIHHLDPEGRRKAIYHHGKGYTDDVVRKDTQYHQERNPRDTFRVFKDKQPFDWQGVTEAEGPGRVDPILYKALARMTKGGYDDAKIALAIEFGLLDMKHNYAIANNYIPKLVDLYNQKHGVAEARKKKKKKASKSLGRYFFPGYGYYGGGESGEGGGDGGGGESVNRGVKESLEDYERYQYIVTLKSGKRIRFLCGADCDVKTYIERKYKEPVIDIKDQGIVGEPPVELLPGEMKETIKTIKGPHGRQEVDTDTPGVTRVRQTSRLGAKSFGLPSRPAVATAGVDTPIGKNASSLTNPVSSVRRIRPRLDRDDSGQLASYSSEETIKELAPTQKNTSDQEGKISAELRKLRAQYPDARSDLEAVAIGGMEAHDDARKHLARVDTIVSKLDRAADQLQSVNTDQDSELNDLDRENNDLEQKIKDLEQKIGKTSQPRTKAADMPAQAKQARQAKQDNTPQDAAPVAQRKPTAEPAAPAQSKQEPADKGVGLGHMAAQLKDLPSTINIGKKSVPDQLPPNVSKVNFDPDFGTAIARQGNLREESGVNPYQENDINLGAYNLAQTGSAWESRVPSITLQFGPNKSLRMSRPQLFAIMAILSSMDVPQDQQQQAATERVQAFKKILSNRDRAIAWLQNPEVQNFVASYPVWQAQQASKNNNQQQKDLLAPQEPVQQELFRESTPVTEVSPEYIERYKKEHGRRATAADQAGDYAKGHEHFKKINQLTKQQFQRGAKPEKVDEISNFMTQPTEPVSPEEQWKRRIRLLAKQYQTNASSLAALARENGPDSAEAVAYEYLRNPSKIRVPGATAPASAVNWDEVIRRLPMGLSGMALLQAAEEYLINNKGMLRSTVRSLLNNDENQRSLSAAYSKKNSATESVTEELDNDEVGQAIARRIMVGRKDLLLKYGPRRVMQAVEYIADRVGLVNKISDNDMSRLVSQVEQVLNGMSEAKAVKTRLDPKCWTGKKIGNPKTKVKGGVRVNNCVPK